MLNTDYIPITLAKLKKIRFLIMFSQKSASI